MKKFNKLLLVSSSLLLAGGVLATYGQLSTNGKPVGQESIADVEKVDLMFHLDDEFEIEPVEGFTLSEEGYASVVKGTKIQFKVKVNDGANLASSGLIVKVNDNEIGDVNGVYKATINKDTEIEISGFIDEIIKHRVSVNAPYGVSVVSEGHEAFPDGSYLLEDDKFEFSLSYLPGFKANSLVVKEGENVLTPNAGVYQVTLNKDVTINVSGVEYRQTKIKLDETDLFSFTNIKGAVVVDGYAYVTDENVSFRIIPSKLADLDASTVVVKHSGTVLTPKNGVYSFVPTETSTIEVSGLSRIIESSGDTGLSFGREVLAEQSVKTIVTTLGAVVSGEVNHLADVANGYKKATYFAGEYGSNQLSINSNDNFEKYNHIEFEINPITGDYIEFFSPNGGNKALFYIREKGWTKVELNKNSDGYHYVINGTDKGVVADASTMISDLQFKMQGTYLFSELVAQKDPEYVDPHHYIDVKALADATYVSGKDEETEFGIKKWYLIEGSSYNVGHNFSDINLDMYKEIYFEFMPTGDYVGGPWFGFNSSGDNYGGFVKDTPASVILTKNDLGKWTLVVKSTAENSKPNLDLGETLSAFKMFVHPNSGKVNYMVTNFRMVDDPEYDPNGQKNVTIVENSLSHLTYTIAGHSGTSFKVDNNEVLTLTLSPESGYDGIVKVNGSVVEGNNNVYSITITKTTTIEIFEAVHHDIVKIADLVSGGLNASPITSDCFISYDPTITTVYQNSKSGGTLFPTTTIDITDYQYLYFYNYNKANNQTQIYPQNSESGCNSCGKKGEVGFVELKKEGGVWNVYINGTKSTTLSGKDTNNFGAFMYMQYWGTSYVSALFGY